jgi:hypothetical protein
MRSDFRVANNDVLFEFVVTGPVNLDGSVSLRRARSQGFSLSHLWRRTMDTLRLIRRLAIATSTAFALLGAVACQNALAHSSLPIRNIQVDVGPLRINLGDPTAAWVQQGLPDQLAKALAGRMTAEGGTLVVRIDHVALGPIKDSSAWDNISGVAMIGRLQWPVRATAKYQASAIDQVMFEESNRRRVKQLTQALTYWLAKDL